MGPTEGRPATFNVPWLLLRIIFGTQQLTYSENVRCQLWQKMDPPMRRHWSGQATLGLMGFSEFVLRGQRCERPKKRQK